jgi:hypothetical protein
LILEAHGVRVELPRGWSGRVFQGSRQTANLHLANFALPLHETASFGDHTTSTMPAGGIFGAITEYLPGPGLSPGTGLFSSSRLPLPLEPTSFSRDRLARPRPGQVGMQHFFTAAGRPFCVYLVLAGARAGRRRQLSGLGHVLATVRIAARS